MRRSAIILRFALVRLESLLIACLLLAPHPVFAADRHWNGNINTTWSTAGNWDALPGTSDNAVFDSSFNNQPALTANTGVGGLWMKTGVLQNVTISGSGFTLTLNGNTISGIAGLGILIDNTSAYTLTISCGLKLNAAQKWLNNSSNLFTVSGAVNTFNKALTIDGSGDTTISGVVSSGGAITKTGTGTLTLSGANTYTGGTNINGGTLQVAATETAGTSGPLGKSGTISFGGGTLQYSASNTFDYSGRFSAAASQAYRIDTNSQNVTFASVLGSVGGTLTKLGSGTLTLSAANTYGGATTISAGTLELGNGGTTGSLATSSAITDNGNFTINRSNAVTQGTTFSGSAITGTGSFTQAGSGTTTLNAANSYSGGTTVSAGTLQLSGISATLGSTSGSLTVNGGTLNLNGTNQTVGNLTGSGGTILNNGTGTNVTLTIGNGNGTGGNYAGVIADHTSGTGTVALTKTGNGTITLSGTNTYTGATTVNAGTLLVNGSISSATGNISVNNSGTTLGGTGTIGGAVTVGNGANLLGGTGSTASGTLQLANNLTLNSGSIIELALGASGAHSTLARTGGTWVFSPNQAFTFINLGAQDATTYNNIITGLGSDPGGESGWTITNTGWIGTFTYDGANIDLNVIVVPEPSTWIAGALALGVVGWAQRRRFSRMLKRR